MKKIMYAILVVMLLAFAGMVFAENETVNQTEEDLTVFNYIHGAEVRLLQLEKVILRNIEVGAEVVGELNSTEAEDILVEMNALLDRIKELDLNQSSESLAEEYVAIKDEARTLSKEFRDLTRGLSKERIEQARAYGKDVEAMFKERINQKQKDFLNDKARDFAKNYGFLDRLDEVSKNGNISVDKVKEVFGEVVRENRALIQEKYREENAKKEIFGKVISENAQEKREEIREKFEARKQEAKERYERARDNRKQVYEEHLENLTEEQMQKIEEFREEQKKRAEQNREEGGNRDAFREEQKRRAELNKQEVEDMEDDDED